MSTAPTRRGSRGWLIVFAASLAALVVSAGSLVTEPDPWGGASVSETSPAPVESPEPTPAATPAADSKTTPSPAAGAGTTSPRPRAPRTTRATPPAPPPSPAKPTRLEVPRLDLALPIVATTLDRAGGMALPDRPDVIGWYAYGPRPGAASGSAVLGGHVDSARYGIGPLVELRRLREGDRVLVQTADGPLRFRVSRIELIRKRALDLDEVFDREGRPVLRVLTCGGPYLPEQGGYQDNVVVTAVRS